MALSLKNFEQQLPVALLRKGQNYYQKQLVREIENAGENTWIAFVDDTESYEVTLSLTKQFGISSHSCDCPAKEPICEHQVAVFYALQAQLTTAKPKAAANEKPVKTAKAVSKKKKDMVEVVLDKLSEQELRDFIQGYAKKNKAFKSDLLIQFANRADDLDKAHYVQMLKQIHKSAADRSGFVDYRNARQYTRQVDALLKQARDLLTKQNFRGPLNIAQAVLEEVSGAIGAMDDSAGGPGENLSVALAIIKQAYQETDALALKQEIFDYLIEQTKEPKYQGYGIDDRLLDLVAEVCEYPEQDEAYEALLDQLQAELPTRKKETGFMVISNHRDTTDDWNWDEQRLIERRMKLYARRGKQTEARALLEANLHLRPLREKMLTLLITEKQFDRARELVNEKLAALQPPAPGKGKRQPVTNNWQLPRQQALWYEWLLKIAQAEDNTARIREYAEWLFRQSDYSNLGYYHQLKKTYPADEQGQIGAMFIAECEEGKNPLRTLMGNFAGSISLARNLANLYIEEKQWDKLMDMVEKKGTLGDVMQYDQFLAGRFSERLLDAYRKKITPYAENNVDTSSYWTVAEVLQRMKQLTGGVALVDELLADYRVRYVRRRKMMEALDKV